MIKFDKYTKEELVSLCEIYSKKIDYLISLNKHIEIHPIKTMFNEQEVAELLGAQRGNCWVAASRQTKDKSILDKIIPAPTPGGEMWRKTKQ